MRKRLLIYVLLLVFLSFSVSAANVEVRTEAENYKVEAGGVAEWTLYLKNNQIRTDYYRISADDLSLAPFSDIVKDVIVKPSQVEVPSLSEMQISVKVYLQEELVADKEYTTYIWVKSLTNPKIKEKVGLSNFIISSRELVGIRAEIPRGVIPGINMPFDATFNNRGNKDLEDLKIYITSNVFNDEKKLNLKAYESLKTGFNFNIDSTTLPGKYSMSIRVYRGDSLKGIDNFDFTVIENPNVIEEDSVEKGFLKKTEILIRENKGNSLVEVRVRKKMGLFGRLFSSVDPDPKVLQFGDGKFYVWDLQLGPGDRTEMRITTNYRIILALILLVVIGFFVFYYFKGKTVTITKTLFRIYHGNEDVTEMKILLHVSNKTEKDVHNIKVIDILPSMIKPTAEFATLKPERIQKSAKGMRIIWNIPKLEKDEERVISYKVRSALPLVGEVELSSASIQYKGRVHKVINVKSNKLVFFTKK